MKIVVQIDRLVLDGFSAEIDTRRIRAAIERELSRLLARTPAAPQWRGATVDQAAAPAGEFAAANRPETVGRRIAEAANFAIASVQSLNAHHIRGRGRGEEL
jgi:hypothetical protein